MPTAQVRLWLELLLQGRKGRDDLSLLAIDDPPNPLACAPGMRLLLALRA